MDGRGRMQEVLAQFGLLYDYTIPDSWVSMPVDEEVLDNAIQQLVDDPKYQTMMDAHFDKVKNEFLKSAHRLGFIGALYDEKVRAFVNTLFPLRQEDKEVEESKIRSDRREYIAKQLARRLEEREYRKSIADFNSLIDIMLRMIPEE